MKLRVKITLALFGVVASMASLGVLGVTNYVDCRQAGADLRQIHDQRFLAGQASRALDHVIVLAQRIGADTGPPERQVFHLRANELLDDMVELLSFAAETEAQERIGLLHREITALLDEYERAVSGSAPTADQAAHSISVQAARLRPYARQLRTLVENNLLQREATATRKLRRSQSWFYASLMLAVLLAGGFGYLLHRMILDPLAALREAIERIRSGELEVELDAEGTDELAEVAAAFVDMSGSLRMQFDEEERLIQQLDEANRRLARERHDCEQLVEIGKATSSTLDLLEVLGVLTTRAQALVACRRCSIFRLDEERPGAAWILSSTHYPQAGPTRIAIEDYPEVGLAIERHETVQVDDVATDERMRNVADTTLRAGVVAVLTVPLMHRGRMSGAIAFMKGAEDGRGFSAWERRVAESIAGTGAICMENAGLYGAMQQSRDEVDALNRTLRRTVEELRSTRDRLVASEKLAAVGGVSTSIAHSLKNPLAAIRALAQADLESGAGAENLTDIIGMVDRLAAHMNQILEFCRTGNETRTAVDPNRTIESVVGMLRTRAEGRGVAVKPRLATDLPCLSANPERFERAVLSVIENAVEACEPGRNVEIVTEREGQSGIRIEVRDEGPGIPRDVLERMFEPFFSTKPGGTGLGTTIARTVVESLAGTVDVRCGPNGGTHFLMRIPGTSIS